MHYSICSVIINNFYCSFDVQRAKDQTVSSITLKTSQTVGALKGPLTELVPSYNDVIKKIHDSLLTPVDVTTSKAVHTQTIRADQTSRFSEYRDPLQVGPAREPDRFVFVNLFTLENTPMCFD